jgi:hypothetical protein
MDLGQAVTTSPAGAGAEAGSLCPRCDAPADPLPPVRVHRLDADVARCLRCGARRVVGASTRPWVFSCVDCGVPFAADTLLGRDEQRCAPCREGRQPGGLPEAELTAAAEAEVRMALSERWRFVGADALSTYLDRLAGKLARHAGVSAGRPRVVLVDADSFRTLALPSATLLVSVGALASMENEAELAFVLGHELAHAASDDAAARLVGLGLDSLLRESAGRDSRAWACAAEDLVCAGYGRRRERAADERAVVAMISAGYDPVAACRLLGRLEERMRAGDPRLAELAASHPTPGDRLRRIERILHARLRGDEPFRLNREVFRRVAGADVLSRTLAVVALDASQREPAAERALPAWVVASAGVGLLAALILLLAYILSG